jgi:hypothetical protein
MLAYPVYISLLESLTLLASRQYLIVIVASRLGMQSEAYSCGRENYKQKLQYVSVEDN